MKFDPATTLVLVIDMQQDFYGDGGNAVLRGKSVKQMQAMPDKIDEFAAHLRKAGARIVFTKYLYDPERSPHNYTEIVRQAKNDSWMCEAGTKGAELDGVHPASADTVIEKFSHDSFAETNLLALCKEWGIETVVLTGVRTEICVLHTACRSFAEGFRTVVVSDLIGTYDNKPEVAAAMLEAFRYFSYIMTSRDIRQIVAP